MLIPVHAYPAINEFHWPARIDFGVCHLGETVTRVIPLECKIPIQFSYEFKVVEPHPDITLVPPKGIIPASGATEITVSFRPASLAVATAEFELSVSQFEFKPIKCVIVGSSAAGMARARELTAATMQLTQTLSALPSSPFADTKNPMSQKLAHVRRAVVVFGFNVVCVRVLAGHTHGCMCVCVCACRTSGARACA